MTEVESYIKYLDAECVSKYLQKEWGNLVAVVEKALKSYSAGKIVQPVRSAVPVEKYEGYNWLHCKIPVKIE